MASKAKQLFQTIDLFARDSDGYTNYRIPGICATPNGVILAHTEARHGRGGDWDAIDIVVRRSFDNGQSWDTARRVVDYRDYGQGPVHNFNPIVDDEGQTWPVSKVIEPELSGYSALTVCPDKTILALFERGAAQGQDTDDFLTLARFNLAWLSDGSDSAQMRG